MNSLVIRTDKLTKRFGAVRAVNGLSLEVPRGHIYGLLGPNGSGKTTLMNMLLGLVKPTSGEFSLFDPGSDYLEALRRVGAIIESPTFYPYMSGHANLAYFQGISGKGTPRELDDLLEQVGLAPRRGDAYKTYSLGMKQRLGVAYALMGEPELMFLDEPTNGMDPAGMAEMRNLIKGLSAGGRTVLISSHLLNEVEQVCDSVAILSKGDLIAQGKVTDLVRSKDRVRVRTTDDAKAAGILSALEWVEQVDADDDGMVVTAPVHRSAELTAALSRSQVYVAAMIPIQTSLEQYFLEVTGEEEVAAP